MPTVHRESGLRFVIYLEDHPPAHVHVVGGGSAKIEIAEASPRLVHSRGLFKPDTKRALVIVERDREMLIAMWKRIHG